MEDSSVNCLFCYNPLGENEINFHTECSKKIFDTETPPVIDFGIDDVKKLDIKILGKSISVTGVQSKMSLDYEKKKGKEGRLTFVGLWGKFILKPPVDEYPNMTEIEDLTMHLAELLKIKTAR